MIRQHRLATNRTEVLIALIVWIAFAGAQTFIFPILAPAQWGITISGQKFFAAFYSAVVSFAIAFPLADYHLPHQRYLAFGVLAFACLAIAATISELVIDPMLFDRPPILAAGLLAMVDLGKLALLLTLVRVLMQRRRSERHLAELERANVEAELKYLKGQIDPHVLFNALNNIYSHALHKREETPELILKLAEMLRFMTYECSEEDVSLERELQFLENYIEMQTLALAGRGHVSFRCSGASRGYRIPPFLLIPFVENCFKHSLDTREEGIVIDIDIRAEDGRLQFDCSNTFDPSVSKKLKPEDNGIGLTNVRRRLELLLGDDFRLYAGPSESEFRVNLNIPVGA